MNQQESVTNYIDSCVFIEGELEKTCMSIAKDLVIQEGSKLTVTSDLDVKRKVIIQYGGFLIVHGNARIDGAIIAHEKSTIEIHGTTNAYSLTTYYNSCVKLTNDLFLSVSSTLGVGSHLSVNGSIKIWSLGSLHECDLAMQEKSSLSVTKDLNCGRYLLVHSDCSICVGNNLKALEVSLGTNVSLRVTNSLSSHKLIIQCNCEVSMTEMSKIGSLIIGTRSHVTIDKELVSLKISMANNSILIVKKTLCVEKTLEMKSDSELIVNDSMYVGISLQIQTNCIAKILNGIAKVSKLTINGSCMVVGSSLYVKTLNILYDACLSVTNDLLALEGIFMRSKSSLKVGLDIRSPCVSIVTDNNISLRSLYIDDNVMPYVPGGDFSLVRDALEEKQKGLIIGCNNTLDIKANVCINGSLRVQYMSNVLIAGDLELTGSLVLISNTLNHLKTSIDKKSPLVIIHGNASMKPMNETLYIINGTINVHGKLDYDRHNLDIIKAIESNRLMRVLGKNEIDDSNKES